MNTKTLITILALFPVIAGAADETSMHYDLGGKMHLTMVQDIYPGGRTEPLAGREIAMTIAMDSAEGELRFSLEKMRASYTAHGMKQRLPTSHLVGRPFVLSTDGRSYSAVRPASGEKVPEMNLGQITDGGLRPDELLAGLLPELPSGKLAVGGTWKTRRDIRTLEGWAWADGDMSSKHEIKSIERVDDRTLVGIKTNGASTLSAAQGREGFLGEGNLTQEMTWVLDVTNGQLVSLSVRQEANGVNQLPQGEVPVRQVTHFELHQ